MVARVVVHVRNRRIEADASEQLAQILDERLKHLNLPAGLLEGAIQRFTELRDLEGLQKKPATGELLAWVKALHRAGLSTETLEADIAKLPSLGALIKTREDLERVTRKRR